MMVCIVKVKLYLYSIHSLKEKRSIIKSIIEKTRHKYHVSVAEVGDQDIWQSSIIGISLVGNDKGKLEGIMMKILDFIENNCDAEITNVDHEIWSF